MHLYIRVTPITFIIDSFLKTSIRKLILAKPIMFCARQASFRAL